MSHNPPSPHGQPRAGLLRRLAALFYDALLLVAVLLIAGALTLPFTQGEAVEPGNPFFRTYLFMVAFFFFAWFWTHGGQTLGMRAWRLRVQQRSGGGLSWWHALLRFLSALPAWFILFAAIESTAPRPEAATGLLGLLHAIPTPVLFTVGTLLLLWDHSPWSWRDRFSETEVVRLPKHLPRRPDA